MLGVTSILGKKSTLFGIVLAAVLGSLAMPVILPHALYGFHIVHIILHVAGITLTIIAMIAYTRLQTRRMGLTIGFMRNRLKICSTNNIHQSLKIITLCHAIKPSKLKIVRNLVHSNNFQKIVITHKL